MKKDSINEFEGLVRPLIKYLNENYHPHTHIIITPTTAEISEGVASVCTQEYIKDNNHDTQLV